MAEELKVNFVNMAHMGKRAANLRKDSMYLCALAVLGLLLIIAISVSGLIMNYLTALASLERSSQGFMTNVPEYMKWSLMPLLDPIRLHLESGLSFVHSKGYNTSNWGGISMIPSHTLPFLENFVEDDKSSGSNHSTRCCYGVFINMGFDEADVEAAGGAEAWWDAHPNDWGDDRMVAIMAMIDENDAFVEWRTYHEEGSSTNYWISQPLDSYTLQTTQPVDEGTSHGFIKFDFLEKVWKTVHEADLKPGSFRYTNVMVSTATGTGALEAHGIMPLYEETLNPSQDDLTNLEAGTWDPGRRVGAWTVGLKLGFIPDLLSSMNLEGGILYLVEESSGIFVGSSVGGITQLDDNLSSKKPSEVNHALIQASSAWIAPDNDWLNISTGRRQRKLLGEEYYVQVFKVDTYGLTFMGVYLVTEDVVLEDALETATVNALAGIALNLSFTFIFIICICVVGVHRFRKMRFDANEQTKAFELKVQEVALATSIANKMANYDLDSAESFLDQQVMSTGLGKPLSQLLNNLRAYSPFLPDSLFHTGEGVDDVEMPNQALADAMKLAKSNLAHVHDCVSKIRDAGYNLRAFAADIIAAFPELQLYTMSNQMSSGLSGSDEYERTLGAFYAVYCLVRLDLDGKAVLSFGVDETGTALKAPIGDTAAKKQEFFNKMNWDGVMELVVKADLVRMNAEGTIVVRHDRLVAMLALTAIHDVMKNTMFLPEVRPEHAPYQGYSVGESVNDHDVALAYILEHFPRLLPTYHALQPGQRAPILFTQGKMGFNNGWLVQGEAPPGLLFSKFKQVIERGRASQADISFYFVHWFTDLAGAEPFQDRPWPGAEKFTVKFPVKVLGAFLESFAFVDSLATKSEVEVMEDYLNGRWSVLVPDARKVSPGCGVACERLVLMAQGFETEAVEAFEKLPWPERQLLSEEMARTGHKDQFKRSPDIVRSDVRGPALLVYYAPALIQKATAVECYDALLVLAAACRAARRIFPLETKSMENTATLRIDALKVLKPSEIALESEWNIRRTGDMDAEVIKGELPKDAGEYVPIDLHQLHKRYSVHQSDASSIEEDV